MQKKVYLTAVASIALIAAQAVQAQTTSASSPVQPAPSTAQDRDIVVVGITPLTDSDDVYAATAKAADIDRSHALDLTEYLTRATAGVYVNDIQNNPLQPDVNYRGYTASPLLGTPQGLSVFLDGVRLNQPFGDVVSWDLIPRAAIAQITLVPGTNPLFGRNSLGGALSIRTKDGRSAPALAAEASYGSFGRRTFQAEAGGIEQSGLNWYATANHFAEDGWRDASPSKATQVFGKLGFTDAATEVFLSGSFADTNLIGNGLQDEQLLDRDRSSIYTKPDQTKNRAGLINLIVERELSDSLHLSGNAYWRTIRTRTLNGDINEESLGENVYQPNAAERAALTAAGITDFPTAGETALNTPFPRFRCIASILLNSEPNERCNGLLNRTATDQDEWGASGQATWVTPAAGGSNRLTIGGAYLRSKADFTQSSQFGYLTPDRDVAVMAGPGAFADGTQDSEEPADARVELTGRTYTLSAYASDAIDLSRTLLLTASARYDRTVVHNRDALNPGGGTGSLDGDAHYNRVNPAASIAWTTSPALTLRASVAETSRAPSAIELGCADPDAPCRLPNALAGDPPLDQVVVRTFEAGASGALGAGTTWTLTAFRSDARDDILFVADDQAGFGFFRNFGRTRRQGIEAGVRGRLGPLGLHLDYTYLDATFRSPETVNGEANSSNEGDAPGFEGEIDIERGDRIPLIPSHIFKAGATWDVAPQLALSADMIALSGVIARGNENGEHEPDGLYHLGEGKTEAYAIFNAGMDYRPAKALTIFVQINNLFDAEYENAAQLGATGFTAAGAFVARPFATPVMDGERPLRHSTFYAPGSPRSARIGARVTF
ncbi:TonB-dependent receptor [Sphingomonas sp.]|uniref:TonB-dependent receptor n=1 Tax=Sphingomonas sp. TaxID=28214 RepID=UPI002ED7DAD7